MQGLGFRPARGGNLGIARNATLFYRGILGLPGGATAEGQRKSAKYDSKKSTHLLEINCPTQAVRARRAGMTSREEPRLFGSSDNWHSTHGFEGFRAPLSSKAFNIE